jgi:hypothetical protein
MRKAMPGSVLFVILVCGTSHPALALRCQDKIVSRGDTKWFVQEVCGEPTSIDEYHEVITQKKRRMNSLVRQQPLPPLSLMRSGDTSSGVGGWPISSSFAIRPLWTRLRRSSTRITGEEREGIKLTGTSE